MLNDVKKWEILLWWGDDWCGNLNLKKYFNYKF